MNTLYINSILNSVCICIEFVFLVFLSKFGTMSTHYFLKNVLSFLILAMISFSVMSQNDTDLSKNWSFYHEKGEYDKAIEQAELIFQLGENTKKNETIALALNWKGQSLLKKSKRAAANRKEAKKAFQRSLELLGTFDNKNLQIDNLTRLRDIAEQEKDTKAYAIYNKQINDIENITATAEANKLLTEQVQQLGGTVEQLGGTVEQLGGTVQMLGSEKAQLQNRVASLSAAQMKAQLLISMQKNYLDSMKMSRMQDSFELANKELALKEQKAQLALQDNYIQLQSSQRNFFIAIAVIMLIIAVGAYFRFSEVKKYNIALNAKNEALVEEQKRSEMLLLNILPSVIAEELKTNGITKARRYEQATVMFTDFKDFSRIAKLLSPEQLVAELDFYFKAFDNIIAKYKIEKIKTIGDSYMCVGGLPDVEGSEPKDVVLAALEIQALLDKFKNERILLNRPYFEARIGIHTGPLVAGVVGSMKFAYDIWGDTVNIASRLESNGQAWRVNISATTYALVKDYFEFENRGIIPIKNNNEIAMYFVNSPLTFPDALMPAERLN